MARSFGGGAVAGVASFGASLLASALAEAGVDAASAFTGAGFSAFVAAFAASVLAAGVFTAGAATFVALDDVDGWTDALAAALRGELAAGPVPTRTPADGGRELATVLRALR